MVSQNFPPGRFLLMQAIPENQLALIGGITSGVIVLIILIVLFLKRKKAAERQNQRESLLAATGNEKELIPVAKSFLASEEVLLEDPALLEAVLKLLIRGGSPTEVSHLLPKTLKKYPSQSQFADLELDYMVAKKQTDPSTLDRLLAGYFRRPDRKDWLSRIASIVYASSTTTHTALKAVGDLYNATSDLKALSYLAEVYEKKKIYNDTSLPFYEEISKREPRKIKWHYALARCKQNLGKYEEAESALNSCLELDANFKPARDLMAMLKAGMEGVAEELPPQETPAPTEPPVGSAAWFSKQKSGAVQAAGSTQPPTPIITLAEPAPATGGTGLPSRYVEVSELGRGGMGIVYKAFDDVLKRWVAIKVLQESNAPNQTELKDRFLSESRVMACLDHPVIPKVFDVSVNPPCYIALEFLEGADFRGYLTSNPNVPLAELVRIGRDLADGFQHAAEKNVLHRDIKPENMLMEKSGRIRILDFGLAKFEKAKTTLTQEGLVVGTPWYMAPERLKGEAATVASEIFAFGVTLYEIFTGKRPFDGDDFSVIFFQEPKPLRQIRKDCPPDLEVLILDCLNKNPANRPRTFKEIRDELSKLAEKLNK